MKTNILLLSLLGTSCAYDETKYNIELGEVVDGLRSSETTVTSGSGGTVTLTIPFEATDSSILLTLKSNALLSLETVSDAEGNILLDTLDWYGESQALTDAIYADSNDVVLNWPIRDSDEQLSAGDWEFTFATLNDLGVYKSDYDATVYTQIKEDEDLETGTIAVTIGLTSDLEGDADLLEGVQAAAVCWQEMWTDFGLELDINWISVDLDPALPYPIASSEIEQVASEGTERDILMLIGETVNNDDGTLGLAGSVPGALIATERSAVVISWLENAGIDAVFDSAEVQTMCETMAHETGHYLGLYHPVESDFIEWDALEDTPMCGDEWDCENEMSDNMMYPYPVCNSGGCVNQVEMSGDQLGVVQRYVGTL